MINSYDNSSIHFFQFHTNKYSIWFLHHSFLNISTTQDSQCYFILINKSYCSCLFLDIYPKLLIEYGTRVYYIDKTHSSSSLLFNNEVVHPVLAQQRLVQVFHSSAFFLHYYTTFFLPINPPLRKQQLPSLPTARLLFLSMIISTQLPSIPTPP